MENVTSNIWNWIVGIVITIVGWVAQTNYRRIDKLEEQVNHIKENYLKRSEYREDINKFDKKLDALIEALITAKNKGK